MAQLGLFFMHPFWDASMCINEMKTLGEHTEESITLLLEEIKQEGVILHEQQFIEYDEGNGSLFECYYYKGVSGDSEQEVKLEYEWLISQMYRRSAFLTIFGRFEYNLDKCLLKMLEISNSTETRSERKNGIPARVHKILTTVIAIGTSLVIEDVDYLRVIRNHIAHNNAFIDTSIESKRLAIEKSERANLLKMNAYNEIILNETFLSHAVDEFERYIKQMTDAVKVYNEMHSTASSTSNPTTTFS
ncbi:hypothetical protein [Klebsiella oxytoca]|uniref:hypothetical protein n=1 Tax=Klebsiella oxytoca TaxID=571 RepID=UPI00195A40A0|nr:hypothetical protein [Klebsiella oxytoca]MBZ7707529.1 hypothetical protein [Klebsiella oxytoca]QRS15556.1 hypothetical protein I6K64_25600 [Klebsiella oxytoca]